MDSQELGDGMSKKKRTSGGFAIYAEFKDKYGANVSVIESSAAEQPCVWIFTDGGAVDLNRGSAHLDRKMALKIRKGLDTWLKETKG